MSDTLIQSVLRWHCAWSAQGSLRALTRVFWSSYSGGLFPESTAGQQQPGKLEKAV